MRYTEAQLRNYVLERLRKEPPGNVLFLMSLQQESGFTADEQTFLGQVVERMIEAGELETSRLGALRLP